MNHHDRAIRWSAIPLKARAAARRLSANYYRPAVDGGALLLLRKPGRPLVRPEASQEEYYRESHQVLVDWFNSQPDKAAAVEAIWG